MKLVGYLRGAREDPCAIINCFLEKRGKRPVFVLSDAENEYRAFRTLQNAVKRGLYDAVILPSYDDLGDDKYSRLENELFFKRNGVKLIFVRNAPSDGRRSLVIAAKRFSSFVTEWDEDYGLSMPEYGNPHTLSTNVPFGYTVRDGEAQVDPGEAECVRRIFYGYIEGKSIRDILRDIPDAVSKRGKPFSNMTVKTVLRNRHYLGARTKKGILLPPIIRYGTWLTAKERIEKEYGAEQMLEPYYNRIYSDIMMDCFRTSKGSLISGKMIDSDALEKALEREISSFSAKELTKTIMSEHIAPELYEAKRAYCDAVKENNRLICSFRTALDRVSGGDFSDEAQAQLETLSDRKIFSAMRVRRIRSESELYSLDEDQLYAFLERAERISYLSREERAFIADTFVRYVRIKDGVVTAKILDPASGRYVSKELSGILE